MKHEELIDRVCRLHYAGMRTNEESEMVVGERWVQRTTPWSANIHANGVFHSELAEDECDGAIERAKQHFRLSGVPMSWVVTPRTRPLDFESKLAEHGFELAAVCVGMHAPTSGHRIAKSEAVKFKELGLENLGDYLIVQRDAWNIDTAGLEFFRKKLIRQFSSNVPRERVTLLAYLDDVAVGCGSMGAFGDHGGLFNCAIVPKYRNYGIYRTLVARRLEKLAEMGIEDTFIHCIKETSAPICKKLGFAELCEVKHYRLKSP